MDIIYRYTPERHGKWHILIPLALFIFGIFMMLCSGYPLFEGVRFPFQLVCLASIAAGIILASRYSVYNYDYTVSRDENGAAWFVVSKIMGNGTRLTVFTSPVSGALKIMTSDEEYKEYKQARYSTVSFCMNMFSKSNLFAAFTAHGCRCAMQSPMMKFPDDGTLILKLEYDSELSGILYRLCDESARADEK